MKVSSVPGAFGLLYTFLAVSSFSSTVFGQISGAPNLSTVSNVNGISDTNSATNTGTGSSSATGTALTGSGSSSGGGSTTRSSGSASTGSATQTIPRLTTTAAAGGLTGLPKLSNGFSIPTAAVPPTANAPYMKHSSMPEGTVFIAVGSILGFMALAMLAWRGLMAWSLHRAMNRSATADTAMDKKALFGVPAPIMYKYTDRESKASLSNFGKTKKNIFGGASGAPSAQSLFFSPTAGAAGSGAGAGNRGSNYLPAGYYAAGASAPGDGRGSTYIGSQPVRESISLANLVPHAQGYTRPVEYQPSPPDSPSYAPAPMGHNSRMSTSTLDLRLPNGRAPSAVLDDLFDGSAENLPRQGRH